MSMLSQFIAELECSMNTVMSKSSSKMLVTTHSANTVFVAHFISMRLIGRALTRRVAQMKLVSGEVGEGWSIYFLSFSSVQEQEGCAPVFQFQVELNVMSAFDEC